jgi:hypothetical protein
VRRVGAGAHRCSLAVAAEDEPDEAVLEVCSPEHEWRHNGGEEWRQLELSARAKEGARELRREGKRGQ